MRMPYLALLIGVIVALSAVSLTVSGQQQVWRAGYCDNVYTSGYVCPAGQTLDTKTLTCVTPKVDPCDPATGGNPCDVGCPDATDPVKCPAIRGICETNPCDSRCPDASCAGFSCGNYNKCGTACGKVCDAGCPSVNTPVCGNPCAPGGAYATTPGKCGNPCNYGTTLVNGECVPVTWCSDGVTSVPPAARCPVQCSDGSFAATYSECPDTTGCNYDGCCICRWYANMGVFSYNDCHDIYNPAPATEACPDGYGSDCGQCGLDTCSVVSGSTPPPPAGDPCGGDPSCGDPCVFNPYSYPWCGGGWGGFP